MATLKSQSPQPQSLSPSTSGRQPTNNNNHNNSNNHNNNNNNKNNNVVCNSPEFEFWMVRNPSCPQPNLLPADQLFFDGIVLPLHLLHHRTPNPEARPTDPPDPQPGPSPSITDPTPPSLSSSKRWKDIIFRKTNKTKTTPPSSEEQKQKPTTKEKKKEKKKKSGPTSSSPELNINIWPFSRSRSAGNASNRPKFPGPVSRKVNSAPCSRSNSAGDSKSRKWPTSPGRAGVHVGRSSPVWQARRPKSSSKNPDPVGHRSKISAAATAGAGGGSKTRVLNLNVPMCIGYRGNLSCRSEENDGSAGAGAADSAALCGVADDGGVGNAAAGSGGNIFNLRSLFIKKSMVTSH